MSMLSRVSLWGAGAVIAGLVAYVVWALAGFPGDPEGCLLTGQCYCEQIASGTLVLAKQPANTISAFGAVLVGLYLLVVADRERGSTDPNPMRRGGFYPVVFGALVIFLGFGSMAFHGSLTLLGGWLDTLSMILFMLGLLVYTAARAARIDDRYSTVAALYVATATALGALTWCIAGSGIWVFAVLVAAAVIVESVVSIRAVRGIRREFVPWLGLTFAGFAVAFAIWFLSRSDAPLCQPDSLLQGHAVWHLLAMALVPFLIFRYYRTETRT